MALIDWPLDDHRITVSHKVNALTVSLTEEELASYDLAGRFLGSYSRGINTRRGLDNTFQQRWRTRVNTADHLRHRHLSVEEATDHLEYFRSNVSRLVDNKAAAGEHPATAEVLRLAAGFTYDRLTADAETFTQIYGHIPILPPDQYRALVIQATDGCTYNRCAFCTLYRDTPYRVRPLTDFRHHVQQVLDFIGASLTYRTSIFLGDANAIAIATPRLVEFMEILRDTPSLNPIINQGGIHAFLDIYTGTHKSTQDYQKLRSLGLRRVSLGVESGNEELLAFVSKQGTHEEIINVVSMLKAAGLAVAIILMVGLGGDYYRETHLADSTKLVRKLPLTRNDIIYLSQFNPDPKAPYITLADQSNIKPMTAIEIDAETVRWKTVLNEIAGKAGPKVAPYNFQRFIY